MTLQLKPPLLDHERRVKEMMIGFGQLDPLLTEGQSTDHPWIPDLKTRILRVRLLLEEVFELAKASGVAVCVSSGFIQEAHLAINQEGPGYQRSGPVLAFADLRFAEDPDHKPDLVEIVDGLADISVVNTGAFVSYGVRMGPILEAVDANNLMKVANGHLDGHGKFIKPQNHPKVNLTHALRLQGAWERDLKDAASPDNSALSPPDDPALEQVRRDLPPGATAERGPQGEIRVTGAAGQPAPPVDLLDMSPAKPPSYHIEIPEHVVLGPSLDDAAYAVEAGALPTNGDGLRVDEQMFGGPHHALVVKLIQQRRLELAASWMEADMERQGVQPGTIDPASLRLCRPPHYDIEVVAYKMRESS